MTNKTDPASRDLQRDRARILVDPAGSILSVRVRGEIDHHTASDIRRGIDAVLFEKRPKKLLLDLSAVSFMDSSGLGLILGRAALCEEMGAVLRLCHPGARVKKIFAVAGLDRLSHIETEE